MTKKYQKAIEAARTMRMSPTKSEAIVWQHIRKRQILGFKFLRQHPIFFNYEDNYRFFIADFYCAEKRLVIEIDGEIHNNQIVYDEIRTSILGELGIQTLRFQNKEVDEDIDIVIDKIKKTLLSVQ